MFRKLDDDFAKYISKKYNIPATEVRAIYKHPFLFLKELIKHPGDTTPLKLRYLGKFQLKARWANKKIDTIDDINASNIKKIEEWEKKTGKISKCKTKLANINSKLNYSESVEHKLRLKLLKEADNSFGKAFKLEDISTLIDMD